MGRPKRLYPHGRYRLRTSRQIENDKPYPMDLEYTWYRQAVRKTINLFIKETDWNHNRGTMDEARSEPRMGRNTNVCTKCSNHESGIWIR